MSKRLLLPPALLLGQLLTGCAVYMPIQCAAPQITDQHQAEISGSGPNATRPVQLQAAWGTSTSLGYDDSRVVPSSADYQLQQPRGYTTIGISVFPHCLFRQAQPDGGGY